MKKALWVGLIVLIAVALFFGRDFLFQVFQAQGSFQVGCGNFGGCENAGIGKFSGGTAQIGIYEVSADCGFPAYDENWNVVQCTQCGGLLYTGYHGLVLVNTPQYNYKVYETNVSGATGSKKWITFSTPTYSTDNFNVTYGSYGGSSQFSDCYAVAKIDFNVESMKKKINITVNSPKNSYFRGENATVDIHISNNLMTGLKFNGNVQICTPVFSNQNFCETYTQTKVLSMGDNSFTLTLPTDRVTDTLTATITYNIYFPDGYFSGDLYPTGSITKLSSNDNIDIFGQQNGNTKTLMIIPRPLVTEPPCTSGYTLKNNNCLSNDVLNLNLNCLVLGCPNVQGALYSCTSSGVCAETIVQYINVTVNQTVNIDCDTTGCPFGSTCTGFGAIRYCLRNEFINVISQCNASSDCMLPCSGINVNCNQGVCDYSGSCTPVTVGCNELGCNEGYTCTGRNVCEKTTIINTITNIVPIWVWYLIGLLVVVLIIALAAASRRK